MSWLRQWVSVEISTFRAGIGRFGGHLDCLKGGDVIEGVVVVIWDDVSMLMRGYFRLRSMM